MFKGILMCVRSLVTIGRIFRAQWAAQKVTKKWKNMFDNFVPGVWRGALKSIPNILPKCDKTSETQSNISDDPFKPKTNLPLISSQIPQPAWL